MNSIKMRLWVKLQQVKDNLIIKELALRFLLYLGLLSESIGMRNCAIDLLSQVHRSTCSTKIKKKITPRIRNYLKIIHKTKRVSKNTDIRHYFGNRIMVLKEKVSEYEPGVLYVMFSETMCEMASQFNLDQLLKDYILVFEPSWSGYCDKDILFYTKFDQKIFILAAEKNDFRFLTHLKTNLVPVELGPCDWVDPRIAEPYLNSRKRYDIVMNSNWGAWKRHYVLFDALKDIKRTVNVALIGVPWGGRTSKDVLELARYFGVDKMITLYEKIAYKKVMKVTCESKISLLLSLKEGSNRAIAESFFCNVPAIVLKEHIGGIKKNIVEQTGQIVPQALLPGSIEKMLQELDRYQPRNWALKNISCFESTRRLNLALKRHMINDGFRWTVDITARCNSPESKYCSSLDADRFKRVNEELSKYLVNA